MRAFLLVLILVLSACRAAAPTPRHLVLVTLDTVRADRLGAYGRKDGGTPWLDGLARRGTVFERAYTAAPLTLPAHVSILTGRYPTTTQIHLNGETGLPASVPTAAEILSQHGFFTGAAVGGYPVAGRFPTRRGFDTYDDALRVGAAGEALERPASQVVHAALRALSSSGERRVFLWVHLFDAHDPYEPPSPFRERFAGDLYQGEIASMDAALANLGPVVEKALGKDVLWVVVADHGESLGEHGEETHGYFLYDATLRVPLLLAGPGVEPGAVVSDPVRTVDVLPTVLARLGVPLPPGLEGTDLWSKDPRGRRAYAETRLPAAYYGFAPLRSAIDGSLKYIDAPRPELYDLRQDPSESRNIRAERREDAGVLSAWLRQFGSQAQEPAAMDPRLASLGYLGLPSSSGVSALDPKDGLPTYRHFQTAARALEQGKPGEALPILERLLTERDAPSVRLKMAQALRMSGRLVDASRELARAGKDPALPGLHLEGARIAAAREEWSTALRDADAHLRADPASTAARLLRGAALEMTGHPAQAEADYRAALGVDPAYREASLRLAALLVRAGRISEARVALEQHLRLHPGDPLAAGLLGAL
ncbi:MAG TPA: sulfatase-like hydrolase/transferase [Candidatus Polarisedimenticolaceae bacterium]|nr:sulfatase-like hydrolase/transferase [Candidatus Polarisedimenticolaceae bacterium]